jgi:tetratricopeptide (TPR) repeat protein
MSKQIKTALIICLLVVVGVGIYAYTNKSSKKAENNAVTVNRSLEDQQRQRYERNAADAQVIIQESNVSDNIRDAYVDKGEALQKLGRLGEAMIAFNEALKIDGNNANAYMGLYEVQLELTDIDSAKMSIRRSLDINSRSASRWKEYLRFSKENLKADFKELNAIYDEAITKNPETLTLITDYAKFLEESGDYRKARDQWVRATQLEPENKVQYDSEIARLDEKIKTQPQ